MYIHPYIYVCIYTHKIEYTTPHPRSLRNAAMVLGAEAKAKVEAQNHRTPPESSRSSPVAVPMDPSPWKAVLLNTEQQEASSKLLPAKFIFTRHPSRYLPMSSLCGESNPAPRSEKSRRHRSRRLPSKRGHGAPPCPTVPCHLYLVPQKAESAPSLLPGG